MSEEESTKTPGGEKSFEKDVTKQTFRKQVWDYLEKNNLSSFPRPAYGRIPNFKGAEQAAAKLEELDVFKAAKSVEVNPDKPLESSRITVLEHQKDLYVPIPRLKESLLKKLSNSGDGAKNNLKRIVSRWGIENTGVTVDLNDEVHIDLLIVGSVAVSKTGYRIGKGKGYADLEFAVLKDMKAIDDDTIIVTTVHDSQVFDELPKALFKEYDVPVDYILTPTQIIKVDKKLPRPRGIIWNLLSQRRVNLMQILQKLKEKHESESKDTTLKEVDTDVESEPRRFSNRFRRFRKRRPRSQTKTDRDTSETSPNDNGESPKRYRGRRFFNRSRSSNKNVPKSNSPEETTATENGETTPVKKSRTNRKPFRHFRIDFSVLVSNIERNVRVRDLKNALNDHGIKPDDITWRGYKGFCYLHYAKPNKNKRENTEEQKPFVVDNVIEILQSLKISPESKTNLSVKVMEPITRIETTDVTAV